MFLFKAFSINLTRKWIYLIYVFFVNKEDEHNQPPEPSPVSGADCNQYHGGFQYSSAVSNTMKRVIFGKDDFEATALP